MFLSREDAIKKAKINITVQSKIVGITDDWTILNVYNIPSGCWYFIFINDASDYLQSSSYLAISKVEGRIIEQGRLDDEG